MRPDSAVDERGTADAPIRTDQAVVSELGKRKNEAFISYSRKDQVFVRRLHAALQSRNRDVWADWEDIPPTAKWMEEIHAGIEGSDNFIFILSPDSLASEVCGQELAHAIAHNKRLIPLLYREVAPGTAPKELSSHNWIYCRETDDFEQVIEVVIRSMDTDLSWTRAHTRFLTRAIEWTSKDRNRSYLLRGSDLFDAEQWLVEGSAGKEPKPTALQTEYVFASRRSERARQGTAVSFATAALVLISVLAVLAMVSRQQAIALKVRAEAESVRAKARQYAAQAQLARNLADLTGDFEQTPRSISLAIESLRLDPTLEADQTLRAGLAVMPRFVRAVSYSRNILAMSVTDKSEMLRSIDEDGLAQSRRWREEGPASTLPGKQVAAPTVTAMSADGKRIATAIGRRVQVYDSGTGQRLPKSLLTHTANVYALALSSNGALVAIGGEDGVIRVWDVDSGRQVQTVQPLRCAGGVTALAFRWDGSRLAAGGADGALRVFLWPAGTAAPLANPIQYKRPLTSLAFNQVGNSLATGTERVVQVWGTDGSERIRVCLRGNLTAVAFSPDSSLLFTAEDGREVTVWEASAQQDVADLNEGDSVRSIAFSADGTELAAATLGKRVHIWDWRAGQSRTELSGDRTAVASALAFSGDGKKAMMLSESGALRTFDRATGKEQAPPHFSIPGISAVAAFSADGSLLSVAQGNAATIWDWAAGKQLGILKGNGPISAVALSRDTAMMAIADGSGIHFFDWRAAKEIAPQVHIRPTSEVLSIAFSPDGHFIVTAGKDGSGRVWNRETGAQLSQVTDPQWLQTSAFSPDGTYVATAGNAKTTRIWLWRPKDLIAEARRRLR
jgi:WD40 repeat protein